MLEVDKILALEVSQSDHTLNQEVSLQPAVSFNQEVRPQPGVSFSPEVRLQPGDSFNQEVRPRPGVSFNQEVRPRPSISFNREARQQPGVSWWKSFAGGKWFLGHEISPVCHNQVNCLLFNDIDYK